MGAVGPAHWTVLFAGCCCRAVSLKRAFYYFKRKKNKNKIKWNYKLCMHTLLNRKINFLFFLNFNLISKQQQKNKNSFSLEMAIISSLNGTKIFIFYQMQVFFDIVYSWRSLLRICLSVLISSSPHSRTNKIHKTKKIRKHRKNDLNFMNKPVC